MSERERSGRKEWVREECTTGKPSIRLRGVPNREIRGLEDAIALTGPSSLSKMIKNVLYRRLS